MLTNKLQLSNSIRVFILSILCLFASERSIAQVGINSDNSNPDASTMLDIKSTDKGILIPRMTSGQRDNIQNLVEGFLIFNVSTNSDEDLIRFSLAGTEQWIMKGAALEPANTGKSVFIGTNAGENDDLSDNNNVFVGFEAGKTSTTGSYNIGTGVEALYNTTTGVGNVAVGYLSLNANLGYRNTAVGTSSFSISNTVHNSTAIGYNAEPTASNAIRLGNSAVSSIGGYANWINVSDGRFKTNVQENVEGLEFIMKLRPVTYNLNMDAIARFNKTPDSLRLRDSERLKQQEVQSGFIAQEVEQAANGVGYDFHGLGKPKNSTSHYGLRYAEFVVPIVKAMQEQINALQLPETNT